MSHHDEPIFEYEGKPCRVKCIYTGADGRQYHQLDIGIVPTDTFFANGKPIYGTSIYDLLFVKSVAVEREAQRLLLDLAGSLYIFQKETETIPNTVNRIVNEYKIEHGNRCWNCGSEGNSKEAVCANCGKLLRFEGNLLASDPDTYINQPISQIVTPIYLYIFHPGGPKWIPLTDILRCILWIKKRWIGIYRYKQQCWNCKSSIIPDRPPTHSCPQCGKDLGFTTESLRIQQEKLDQIIMHYSEEPEGVLAEKLEKAFQLDPPLPDQLIFTPYSQQMVEIFGRRLTSVEQQRVDQLYEYQWWESNRCG